MDYNLMMQKALLGMVKDVLSQIQAFGLEDEQHLYISFRTDAKGVIIPTSLHQKFPEEMTIILQYQFWDLCVTDDYFSIKLSFNGKPEPITVPFSALTKIFDPSVQFGLQFIPESCNDDFSGNYEEESISEEKIIPTDKGNVIDFIKFKNRLTPQY